MNDSDKKYQSYREVYVFRGNIGIRIIKENYTRLYSSDNTD